MLIGIVEHNTKAALMSFIEDINSQPAAAWGVAVIQRPYIKDLSNNEIVLALKPALLDVTRVKVFFLGKETIYVTWFGMPKQTYQKLADATRQSLLHTGIIEGPERVISYTDPLVMGDELKMFLKTPSDKVSANGIKTEIGTPRTALDEMISEVWLGRHDFLMAPAEAERHKKALERKPHRQRLNMLIVEDQFFLRNLLSDVLRIDYEIDTAADLKTGWELYVEKAPDIVFLDIQLPDGSGHLLAHAIKRVDASAYVVMATASNQLDDVEFAKLNHVDGFILKPFNKKKISDCIDRYLATYKTCQKRKDL